MDLVLIDYSKGTEGHRSASPDHFCKTYHFLQKMTQSTKTTESVENVVNRDSLQDSLITSFIDSMDLKTMWSVLYDYMDQSYDKYSIEELIEEVKEWSPELLEGN